MADTWTAIIGLLSGSLGATVGVSTSEFVRRRNRIETYSSKVFERRLDMYEQLSRKMLEGSLVANRVMEEPEFSADQRRAAISAVVMDIAKFTDENWMYLDRELSGHCVATFMGAEDVLDNSDEDARENIRRHIREMYKEARRMIREDAGVASVERLFKKVTKPNLTGAFIELLRSEMKRASR